MTAIDFKSFSPPAGSGQKRIFMVGATGTIGRATLTSVLDHGYEVVCFFRNNSVASGHAMPEHPRLTIRYGDITHAESLAIDGFRDESFDLVISCLASRTGVPRDAWKIDYEAHSTLLQVAKTKGIKHFILLSALCVQKPRLEFQHAKLAFERELIESGLTYSIIRPTAFFKSLSGQVDRVNSGKAFLIFGDGRLTACKPISDRDLAKFILRCIHDDTSWNKILPIGGPGPAITPRDQGDYLFSQLRLKPNFKSMPLWVLKVIIACLTFAGRYHTSIADKAELARIGYYYATESMLVFDIDAGRYDEHLTPSTGQDTLFDHYDRLIRGEISHERGDHSVF